MSLTDKVTVALTAAMKAKDEDRKRTLRDIKAQILLLQTDGSGEEITEEKEIKLLQKMVKQREESLGIYQQQGRAELAQIEQAELDILREFLPKPLSESELDDLIKGIIAEIGASGMKDMGKVVGATNQRVQGRAEGKAIAAAVKKLLV